MTRILEKFYTLYSYNFPSRMFSLLPGKNVLTLENGRHFILPLKESGGEGGQAE
jgi:hypothetical protein